MKQWVKIALLVELAAGLSLAVAVVLGSAWDGVLAAALLGLVSVLWKRRQNGLAGNKSAPPVAVKDNKPKAPSQSVPSDQPLARAVRRLTLAVIVLAILMGLNLAALLALLQGAISDDTMTHLVVQGEEALELQGQSVRELQSLADAMLYQQNKSGRPRPSRPYARRHTSAQKEAQ